MSDGAPLVDASRVQIKLGSYGTAPPEALAEPRLHPRVQDFRRQLGGRTTPLDKAGMKEKLPKTDYLVTRKVDGEFSVLIYRDGQAITLNPGGTVRVGLPVLDEAARLLSKAGATQAMLACELYVDVTDRRPRVHDVTQVARQPSSEDDLKRLKLAVFDVLEVNGEGPPSTVDELYKLIKTLTRGGKLLHPVEAKSVSDARGVVELFEKWVESEGSEGLVVRSDMAGMFKIKPRHNLDVAVLGFSVGVDDRADMLHDLLIGLMRQDGCLQVFGRVGGGFSDEQRRDLLADLRDIAVDSEYTEVNSEHVGYTMVRPEWVIEINCLDLISHTTRGLPIERMVLEFDASADCYRIVRRLPLASIISPQFVRRREDKSVNPQDVRVQQIAEVVHVPNVDRDARQLTLPKSEVLRREVWTKSLKGKTMVRKLMLWKTNKHDQGDDFPAYVAYMTDFSPNRKDPLSREVRVSNDAEQIEALYDELKDANIKRGWDPVDAGA